MKYIGTNNTMMGGGSIQIIIITIMIILLHINNDDNNNKWNVNNGNVTEAASPMIHRKIKSILVPISSRTSTKALRKSNGTCVNSSDDPQQ